ncbi:hypothetical protein GCM10007103_07300 [Salinimicrobium marinum]|uniref:AraC effector-binding domain-containing protein n=1 Tax=Salinimicrobium marinum TaxID=680283 RepID=A0A918VTT8_9FLAO|nr:GyrI-like domain-containing protein [Salinimicrobium marinum]GHA28263.1 hypothetical protein GCM10007103_07300 [Salinimicrobium marinum]
MKIIKYLLFLLLIAIIAGSIYVATKDGNYTIEESRIINAPTPLLFNEVNDFSTWATWSPWKENEEINISLTEITKGEGAEMLWESGEMRDGKITTVEVIPYTSINQINDLQIRLGESNSEVNWEFEPAENGTRVTWIIKGKQSFKEKLAFLIQDQDLYQIFAPKLEEGLEGLEREVIMQMEKYSINVDGVTQHSGGYYMYSTTAARMNEVNEKAAEMIRQVSIYMEDNNISISGKPFVLYNQRDEQNGTTIFSAAVPTSSQMITPAGSPVIAGQLPPQRAVKTTLRGNRKNALEAWEETYSYINDNGLEVDPQGTPFEVYITNPAEEENPARLVTEIYIPVRETGENQE